jgi:hypothetical protein
MMRIQVTTISSKLARRSLILTVAGILWLVSVGFGMKILWDYANLPGKIEAAPAHWPGATNLRLASGRATLVMFLHPRCPCSRASIGELALLMTRCHGKVDARVVFYKPADADDDWAKTDLWRSAEEIPDVEVIRDEDGIEAARFGAATSGEALLFDSEGRLMFNGGITAARGHAGDNEGRSAIVALLTEDGSEHTETPVFGCPIFDERNQCHKEGSQGNN